MTSYNLRISSEAAYPLLLMQTTKRACSDILLINVPLDLQISFSDAMSFIPMELCATDDFDRDNFGQKVKILLHNQTVAQRYFGGRKLQPTTRRALLKTISKSIGIFSYSAESRTT